MSHRRGREEGWVMAVTAVRSTRRPVRRWMWLNGLALVMLAAFTVFAVLQSIFGWQVRNSELIQAGLAAQSYWHYLGTGHFAEATFENWESEFLQMGSYVLLTAFLVQRGSPESKPLDQDDRPDDQPERAGPRAPRPSRTHGLPQWLYRNSLSLVLFAFFALSFVGHLLGGTAAYNEEQALQTGSPPIPAWQFLGSADFWFQSMQNWQSEFLAVGSLIVLGVVLRQHGSPESKPVTAPDDQTGE
jgi:quinol-cytochrome oxidoreductase complex cytochrome b subunit